MAAHGERTAALTTLESKVRAYLAAEGGSRCCCTATCG
jgi:hypothetical protein